MDIYKIFTMAVTNLATWLSTEVTDSRSTAALAGRGSQYQDTVFWKTWKGYNWARRASYDELLANRHGEIAREGKDISYRLRRSLGSELANYWIKRNNLEDFRKAVRKYSPVQQRDIFTAVLCAPESRRADAGRMFVDNPGLAWLIAADYFGANTPFVVKNILRRGFKSGDLHGIPRGFMKHATPPVTKHATLRASAVTATVLYKNWNQVSNYYPRGKPRLGGWFTAMVECLVRTALPHIPQAGEGATPPENNTIYPIGSKALGYVARNFNRLAEESKGNPLYRKWSYGHVDRLFTPLRHMGDLLAFAEMYQEDIPQFNPKWGPARLKQWDRDASRANRGLRRKSSVNVEVDQVALAIVSKPPAEAEDSLYRIEEILPHALHEEGQLMHHCIAGYEPTVRRGQSRIYHFGLKDDFWNAKTSVTVAIRPDRYRLLPEVFQAHGLQNRSATKEEAKAIAKLLGFSRTKED